MSEPLPFVSFVLPVLNTERIMRPCLRSIRAQDYPSDRYEILMADGGSTDLTRAIAAEFGATILENPQRRAEPGKQVCFARAAGRYIVFVDADNEIASTDWLSRAVAALERHPDALGFESYYLKNPSDCALNHYATALLQCSSDPVVRSIARQPRLIREEADGTQVFELPGDGSYPTGANGFIFRRELLAGLGEGMTYHEASFFPDLIRGGRRTLLKIRGCGVYHYYVSTWSDYLAKRRYTMVNYLLRKEEFARTWEGRGVNPRMLAALAYHATLVGPAVEGLLKAAVRRDPEWLLHPAASFMSTLGNVMGWWDYRRSGSRDARTSASVRLHRHASRR